MESRINWTSTLTDTHTIPSWYVCVVSTALYMISFTTVVANVGILFTTISSHGILGNTIIVNTSLSICNLLFGIVAGAYASVTWTRTIDETACSPVLFLGYVCAQLYIMHIILMNTDKYIYIIHPLLYNRLVTRKKILLIFLSTWLSTAPLSWMFYQFIPFALVPYCIHVVWNIATSIGFLFAFVITPMTVMTFSYVRIYSTVCKHARVIHQQITDVKLNTSTVSANRTEKRLVKMIILMFGSFMISWIPYVVFGGIQVKTKSIWITDYVLPAVLVCAFTNPLISSLLFIKFNSEHRKAFKVWLKCRRKIGAEREG